MLLWNWWLSRLFDISCSSAAFRHASQRRCLIRSPLTQLFVRFLFFLFLPRHAGAAVPEEGLRGQSRFPCSLETARTVPAARQRLEGGGRQIPFVHNTELSCLAVRAGSRYPGR